MTENEPFAGASRFSRVLREKWPKVLMLASKTFFFLSVVLFVVCISRLFCRFFQLCPAVWSPLNENDGWFYKFYTPISGWCCHYMPEPATSAIFAAMGIINFSYSHVITARDKCLYGIHLSDVMQAQFPWHGKAYILYTFWIILGLYCSKMYYPLIATACMAGSLCTFFSTGIVAYLFVSNHRLEQAMVEYYLCQFKLSGDSCDLSAPGTYRDDAFAYMSTAFTYIREYYLVSQAIPVSVARSIWKKLRFDLSDVGFPTVQLGKVRKTAHLIAQMRPIWQRLLHDLPPDKQADLIRQILLAGAEELPAPTASQQELLFSGSPENTAIPGYYMRFGLPLCSLVSFLQEQAKPETASQTFSESWLACVMQVYLASGLCPGEQIDTLEFQPCTSLLQLLFLLVESSVIVEAAAALPEEVNAADDFWSQLFGLEALLHISRSWLPFLLPWGQSIILSYASDWYGPEEGYLDLYHTCHWICDIILGGDVSDPEEEMT